jgi:2-oxoglutarate dehydrogenase E1 component
MKAAHGDDPRRGNTGVAPEVLKGIGKSITAVPQGFHVHRTIQRFLDARAKAIETGEGIDWATAEALAFCSLLLEGHPVRLSGQDSERGTFSQRHSVLIDQENEDRHTPFNHLGGKQARFEVINSMLSEEAVLGFEYGYSLAEPNALTLWEAQFGDFANGAQVLFDQFISSGERKWLRMSGLVCMLPHGYEGQGPEHSSARLERFLQMCAEDNMQVVHATTPANFFHVLRRQLHREIRKPLILMTPKSLLRHKRAVSRLDELGSGTTFHRILYDDAVMLPDEKIKLVPDDKIRRVVLCSGKVYYDLYDEREKRGIDDVYLMRVEQLYPVPLKALVQELVRFKSAELVWCQEEPRNMGAWHFIEPYLEWVLNQIHAPNRRPRYAGRAAAAATATGLMSKHLAQLKALLDEALS